MIFILILILIFLLLYFNGFLPVSTKRAALFVGNMGIGRKQCSASFSRCSGHIHRILLFRESRSYSFSLISRIRSGDVTVQILDLHRTPLLTLDEANPTGVFSASKGKRYLLWISFRNADGDYRLEWA